MKFCGQVGRETGNKLLHFGGRLVHNLAAGILYSNFYHCVTAEIVRILSTNFCEIFGVAGCLSSSKHWIFVPI